MVPLPQFSEVISRILWPGIKDSQQPPPTAIGRIKQVKDKGARSRDGSSAQKACESSIYIGQGDLVEIKVTHIKHLSSTPTVGSRDSRNPHHGQVRHRLESTWKRATRTTDGYTR